MTGSTPPVAPNRRKMPFRLWKLSEQTPTPTLNAVIYSGSNPAAGCCLTWLADACDSQTAINDGNSFSSPARSCPAARRWDAFLTTHLLHFQRVGGGGAEALVQPRSRAISGAYFSVITLAFCRFLPSDVIAAAGRDVEKALKLHFFRYFE